MTGVHSKTLIRQDYKHIKIPVRNKGYNPLAFDRLLNLKKDEIVYEENVDEEEEIEEVREDDW